MTTYTLSIIVEGKDRASGPLGGIAGAIGRMGEIAGGILAAGALLGIGQGLLNIGSSAITATAQMQAFEMGLQTLLTREIRATDETLSLEQAFAQAAPRAEQLSAAIREIAILSPYELGTVQDTFRLAMAFGFAADEAEAFTRGMLNVAAGVGASNEMLGRMAYNFAQIRLQGKVTAMDIRQLAMAGFDLNAALKDIGEQFGVTINSHEDFNKAIEDGTIKWADFATAFESYADKNFGGASERLARTWQGLQSTFNDLFLLTIPTVLGPALQVFTDFANEILNQFMALTESGAMEEWGKRLGEAAEGAVEKLKYFLKILERVKTFGIKAALKPYVWQKLLGIEPSTWKFLADRVKEGIGIIFAGIGAGGGMAAASLLGLGLANAFGIAYQLGMTALWAKFPAIFTPFFVLVGKLAVFFGGLGSSLAGLAGPLLPLVPIMGALVTGLALAVIALAGFGVVIKALKGDTEFFKNLLGGVQNGLDKLGQFWREQGPAIAEIGARVWKALSDAGEQLAEKILPWLVERFEAFSQWFVDNGPLITEFIEVLATFFTDHLLPAIVGFWEVIEPILTALLEGIGGIATAIMQAITGDWEGAAETLKGVFEGLWEGIKGTFSAFVDWVLSWIGTDWATVSATWAANWEMFKQIVELVWQHIVTAVTTFTGTVASTILQFVSNVQAFIQNGMAAIQMIWTSAWTAVAASAVAFGAQILSAITTAVTGIVSAVTGGGPMLRKAGLDMMAGLMDGISKKAKEILAFVKQLAADIAAAFASVLDMHSPSRVFLGYGKNIVQGLANGIRASGMAVDAIEHQAQAVMSPFSQAGAVSNTYGGPVSITVSGAGDPDAVANAIMRRLRAQGVGV